METTVVLPVASTSNAKVQGVHRRPSRHLKHADKADNALLTTSFTDEQVASLVAWRQTTATAGSDPVDGHAVTVDARRWSGMLDVAAPDLYAAVLAHGSVGRGEVFGVADDCARSGDWTGRRRPTSCPWTDPGKSTSREGQAVHESHGHEADDIDPARPAPDQPPPTLTGGSPCRESAVPQRRQECTDELAEFFGVSDCEFARAAGSNWRRGHSRRAHFKGTLSGVVRCRPAGTGAPGDRGGLRNCRDAATAASRAQRASGHGARRDAGGAPPYEEHAETPG